MFIFNASNFITFVRHDVIWRHVSGLSLHARDCTGVVMPISGLVTVTTFINRFIAIDFSLSIYSCINIPFDWSTRVWYVKLVGGGYWGCYFSVWLMSIIKKSKGLCRLGCLCQWRVDVYDKDILNSQIKVLIYNRKTECSC